MLHPSKKRKISEETDDHENLIQVLGHGNLTIELKYCKWRVHKHKLIPKSTFFEIALQEGKWKVCESVLLRDVN